MILSASYTNLFLGEHSPILYQGEMEVCFSSIKKAGFQAVELHIANPASLNAGHLKDLLSKYNLQLSSLGTGLSYSKDGLSLTNDNEQIRHAAIKRICEYIDLASLFPASVVIIGLIRGNIKELAAPQLYEQHLLHALRICGDYAEQHKTTLVLEMINRYEADFLNKAKEGLLFLQRLNHPSVKLHLDTFHMNIEEVSPANAILMVGDQLGHMHFADSDRFYPGHAHYPFQDSLSMLQKINYRGAISMECLPLPTTEEAALRTISSLTEFEA